MGRLLVKAEDVAIEDRCCHIQYFERRTEGRASRYWAEIVLEPGNCTILDDDSMTSLETKACQLMASWVASRRLLHTA